MTLHRITSCKEAATVSSKPVVSYKITSDYLDINGQIYVLLKNKSLTDLLKAIQLFLVLIIMMHARKH